MLAAGEGLGNMLKIDSKYSIEKVAEITWDFMINGIGSSEKAMPNEAARFTGSLSTAEAIRSHIRDLCCDDRSYLSGELGKGALQVPLA